MKPSVLKNLPIDRILDRVEEIGVTRKALTLELPINHALKVASIVSSFRSGNSKMRRSHFEDAKALTVGIEEALISYHTARLAEYSSRKPEDFAPSLRRRRMPPERDVGPTRPERAATLGGDTAPPPDRSPQGTTGRPGPVSQVRIEADGTYRDRMFGSDIDTQVRSWKVGDKVPKGFMEVGGELVDIR